MIEISINSVEYTNSNDGPVVHVYGRDKDGVSHRVDVLQFRPYFYAPISQMNRITPDLLAEKKEYRSIRGEPLMKVYTKKPTDVRNAREKFDHYEADVVFTSRFLIDMGLKSGMECPETRCSYDKIKPTGFTSPSRFCIVDIECSDANGWPDPSRDPIICLTCYDSFDEKYSTFLYVICDPKGAAARIRKKIDEGKYTHDVYLYQSEAKMLEAFVSYIRSKDPDILTGWNFTGFDAPYIFNRMDTLKMNPDSLGRLHGKNPSRIEIRGRQVFDLLAGYKRMHLGEKESYRLDAIANAELGRQKVRFPGKISALWKDSPELLVEYNFVDVELCVLINQKDKTIEFHREISRYVGCSLDRTLNSMPIIDAYIMRKAHGRYVLPSRTTSSEYSEGYDGATVIAPAPGIKENVVVLDLKSLYPMAMMTVNASPETKDSNGDLRAPNGVRFRSKPDGLVREIQSELLK